MEVVEDTNYSKVIIEVLVVVLVLVCHGTKARKTIQREIIATVMDDDADSGKPEPQINQKDVRSEYHGWG